MTLLAVLAALIAERLFWPQRDAILARASVRRKLGEAPPPWTRSALFAVLLVLLPAALVEALHYSLKSPLLRLLFDTLVLFACLGPRDLADDIKQLRLARARGDSVTVARLTAQLQIGPAPDEDHRSLLGALFIQSHERVFGMLWWFLAAGPAGAVLYRCARLLPEKLDHADSAASHAAAQIHSLLAWLPARLTAALFALAGSMDDAVGEWRRLFREPHPDWRRHTWSVLAEVAAAALDWEDGNNGGPVVSASLDATLKEVRRMQLRALLILLAATALLGAGSWII